MKIYIAGNPGTQRAEDEFFQKYVKRRLLSFFYINDPKDGRKAKYAFDKTKVRSDVDLMIDSGAFSAWSQSTEVDIHAYVDFIKHNELTNYAALDDINDPEKTFQNYKYMWEAGLKPIPTFHYGEDIKYLIQYMRLGCNCIAFGGMVPISSKVLYNWLKNVFRVVPGDVTIHGFGLTDLDLLRAFPWHSVDSSTPILQGGLGTIIVPYRKKGEWDFLSSPRAIQASSTNITKGHLYTLSENVRDQVYEYIKEAGFKLGRSEIFKTKAHKKLEKNESWAEKKSEIKGGLRLLERKVELGITNDFTLRYALNTYYINKVAETITKNRKQTSNFKPFF